MEVEQSNSRRKRIHVIAWMEALSVTGPAKNLLEFARLARAAESTIEITLVTYRRSSHPPSDDFLQAAAAGGVPCEVIAESGPMDWRVPGRMRALVKRLDGDVLQTHNAKSHFLMRLSGLPRVLPWVAFHHGYTKPTRKQELYNQFDRWSLRKAKRVITVTEAFRRELERFGVAAERIAVVHNSIPADWTSGAEGTRLREELLAGAMPGTRLVLAVGRLSREKAHVDLVEAVAQLERKNNSVRLVVVGEGPERAGIEQRAKELRSMVVLTGQVSDTRPYFAAADLFVLPSHSEGSPNVLLEAMAAGLPVVATAVGGVPQTVSHETHGLLVPPAQPAALAEAMARLLQDEALAKRLAGAAAQRIRDEFLPQARARRLEQLYWDVVSGRA